MSVFFMRLIFETACQNFHLSGRMLQLIRNTVSMLLLSLADAAVNLEFSLKGEAK